VQYVQERQMGDAMRLDIKSPNFRDRRGLAMVKAQHAESGNFEKVSISQTSQHSEQKT
jgi:hypothetical protein